MRDWSYASPSQFEGMVDREIYSSRHVAIVISCNTDGYCGAAYDVGTQGSPSLKRLLRLNPQVWLNRVHKPPQFLKLHVAHLYLLLYD